MKDRVYYLRTLLYKNQSLLAVLSGNPSTFFRVRSTEAYQTTSDSKKGNEVCRKAKLAMIDSLYISSVCMLCVCARVSYLP